MVWAYVMSSIRLLTSKFGHSFLVLVLVLKLPMCASGRYLKFTSGALLCEVINTMDYSTFAAFKPQDGLTSGEIFWKDYYLWLQEMGYQLEPRYAPDWSPSWKGTGKYYRDCYDGIPLIVGTRYFQMNKLV